MKYLRRFLRLVLLPAALALSAPAVAQEAVDPLFEALQDATSQDEADDIAREIWNAWLTAPDSAAQALLDAAMRRRQAQDYLGAIRELDRLVEAYPDYAEGWNQRATLHFLRGDFAASLADVDEVLAREPRHFGALSGKAVIHYRMGDVGLAQVTVRKALEIHPFLKERALLEAGGGIEL